MIHEWKNLNISLMRKKIHVFILKGVLLNGL